MSSLYYVLAFDFGYATKELRSSIEDIGDCVAKHYGKDPNAIILAQSRTYAYLSQNDLISEERLFKIETGLSETADRDSTYYVLKQARRMMEDRRLKLVREGMTAHDATHLCDPVIRLVAHAVHAPRIERQAMIFNMVVSAGVRLPREFYDYAEQWWCRSEVFWDLREAVLAIALRLRGEI